MDQLTDQHSLVTVVVGSGLTGLTTALLLARAGHRVTLLERDAAAPPGRAADAWTDWQRAREGRRRRAPGA